MNARLRILNLQSREIFVVDRTLSVGRLETSDIRIPDKSISRQHARIEILETGVFITDLGSSNGSLHNGILVQGSQSLKAGDRIKIGSFEFEVQEEVVDPVSIAQSKTSQNQGSIFIGIFLNEKSQFSEDYPRIEMKERWSREVSRIMKTHGGEIVNSQIDSVTATWKDPNTGHRHQSIAAARTAQMIHMKIDGLHPHPAGLFGSFFKTKVLLDRCQSLNQSFFFSEQKHSPTILNEPQFKDCKIIVSESLLSDWKDSPDFIQKVILKEKSFFEIALF